MSVSTDSGPTTTFQVSSTLQIPITVLSAGAHGAAVTTPSDCASPTPILSSDVGFYVIPRIASLTPNVGSSKGGNLVHVLGKNFVGVTKVLFGSTAATISTSSNNDNNDLWVTAPPSVTGTVLVHVISGSYDSMNAPNTSQKNADYTYQ